MLARSRDVGASPGLTVRLLNHVGSGQVQADSWNLTNRTRFLVESSSMVVESTHAVSLRTYVTCTTPAYPSLTNTSLVERITSGRCSPVSGRPWELSQ